MVTALLFTESFATAHAEESYEAAATHNGWGVFDTSSECWISELPSKSVITMAKRSI